MYRVTVLFSDRKMTISQASAVGILVAVITTNCIAGFGSVFKQPAGAVRRAFSNITLFQPYDPYQSWKEMFETERGWKIWWRTLDPEEAIEKFDPQWITSSSNNREIIDALKEYGVNVSYEIACKGVGVDASEKSGTLCYELEKHMWLMYQFKQEYCPGINKAVSITPNGLKTTRPWVLDADITCFS